MARATSANEWVEDGGAGGGVDGAAALGAEEEGEGDPALEALLESRSLRAVLEARAAEACAEALRAEAEGHSFDPLDVRIARALLAPGSPPPPLSARLEAALPVPLPPGAVDAALARRLRPRLARLRAAQACVHARGAPTRLATASRAAPHVELVSALAASDAEFDRMLADAAGE